MALFAENKEPCFPLANPDDGIILEPAIGEVVHFSPGRRPIALGRVAVPSISAGEGLPAATNALVEAEGTRPELVLIVNDQPVPDPSSVEKYAILYEDFTRITAARDDSRLKEKLVEDYSGLVRAIAKHYFLAGAERDDLLQEGMIGLVKAIRCYDPEAGTPFKKFAQLCIKRQMITAVHVATRGKHTPLNEARSFGTEITRKDGEVGSLTLEDLLPSSSHTPEEIVIAKDELESLVAMLGTKLSPLESDIFRMFLQGMSYRDMAHAVDGDEKVIDNAIQRVKRKMTAYWASREIIVPQAVVA